MPHTIITRVGWCDQCFKENRPHSQDSFLVYGSYRNDYHLKIAQGNGVRGFVPTIYKLVKVIGTNCIIDYACSFCDANIWQGQDAWNYSVTWKRMMMDVNNWNSLCLYKNDNDYTI